MNKAIVIGLFIILIMLVGCTSETYTCYNLNNPNKTVEVSAIDTTSSQGFVLEECRKKLCEVVIIKNE